MTDACSGEWVYQVAVDKAILSDKIVSVLDRSPSSSRPGTSWARWR